MPQRRTVDPTPQMIELFARGRQLQLSGARDVDADGDAAAEFAEIDKRLNWTLLGRAPHMVSVFENLDGDPPAYMQRRNTPSHPDFNGWYTGRELQQRLQAALDAQRNAQRGQSGNSRQRKLR